MLTPNRLYFAARAVAATIGRLPAPPAEAGRGPAIPTPHHARSTAREAVAAKIGRLPAPPAEDPLC